MTGEELAFLEAIRKDPLDDTARLVYADWLDEYGNHLDRAELIRLQINNQHSLDASLAPEVHREEELIRKIFPYIPAGDEPLRSYVRRGFHYRVSIAREMESYRYEGVDVKDFLLICCGKDPIELVEYQRRKPIRMVRWERQLITGENVRYCWVRKSLNQIGLDPFMVSPAEHRDLKILGGEDIHYGEYVCPEVGIGVPPDSFRGRYIVGFESEQSAIDALARSVCNTFRLEHKLTPVIL